MDLSLRSGIKKTNNRQGRRPGKSACVACHSRKKRCDRRPPHYQCSFCTREDQTCIPRDPAERPARHRPNRPNLTNCTIVKPEEKDTSLPPGIDHEIPRWSAMYSFYSEMQRLLPSPTPSSDLDDPPAHMSFGKAKGKMPLMFAPEPEPEPESESEPESGPKAEAEAEPEIEPERNTMTQSVDSPAQFKGISMPAAQTRSVTPVSQGRGERPSLGADAGVSDVTGAERGRDFHGHGEGFMSELDALLQF